MFCVLFDKILYSRLAQGVCSIFYFFKVIPYEVPYDVFYY